MALVLVATGDGELRSALRRALQSEGYTVSGTDDGRRALNTLVVSAGPVVAILDDHLPIFDGLQLLAYLRLLPPDAPQHSVVLLASEIRLVRDLIEGQYDPKSVHLLLKPFTLSALLDAVAFAVSRLEDKSTLPGHDDGPYTQAPGL